MSYSSVKRPEIPVDGDGYYCKVGNKVVVASSMFEGMYVVFYNYEM